MLKAWLTNNDRGCAIISLIYFSRAYYALTGMEAIHHKSLMLHVAYVPISESYF